MNAIEIMTCGKDSGKGNILGLQPFMLPEDYISQEAFFKKFDTYLAIAKEENLISDKTLVVLPEHVGSWLLIAEESGAILDASSLGDIITQIFGAHSHEMTELVAAQDWSQKELAAAFKLKSQTIAQIYTKTFSELAKKYEVTLVGGSVVLQNPKVLDNSISIEPGELYNVTAVFKPTGSIYEKLTKKVHLVPLEQSFLTRGSLDAFPTYETPLGKLAVLICADCWYEDTYQHINNSVDIISVPSYQSEMDLWDKPWRGYSTDADKASFDEQDIGVLTEGQAWEKYALKEKISKTHATAGINVFLKGSLWDMGANSGHSSVFCNSDETSLDTAEAGFVNCWLD